MKRLIACALLACLTGCSPVSTEHDIAGPKDEFATFEPRLVGDWELKEEDPPKTVHSDPNVVGEFLRLERTSPDSKALLARSFKLVKAADGGAPTEVEDDKEPPVEIRFVKLGNLELISFRAKPTATEYFVGKVAWTADGFAVSAMEATFFEKNPKLVSHRKEKSGVTITASVEALHDFLKANGDRADLWWKPESRLIFQKRKPPAAK